MSGWGLLGPLFAGFFCVALGITIVFDIHNVASRFVAAARDKKAQRVINEVVGWGFVGIGMLFVAIATVDGVLKVFTD
ncbi:hypothetical protein ACHZ98_34765 [Streptomyces sp. MAR4 CNY-716]